MSVGSIGSTPSFWQQDQDYWSNAQAQAQAQSADNALINVMGQAEVNQAKGLAAIANGTALKRTNSQLTSLIEQVLDPSGSGGSSSSSGGSSSSGASSQGSAGAVAVAVGTARVTATTPLANLGIIANGTIVIGAGGQTTTYVSNGSDTVGDLINAVNVDLPTNADVTASINNQGQVVFTAKKITDTITVEGDDAINIGFGVNNNTFDPTPPSTPAAPAASTSSSSTSSSSSSGSSSSSSSKALPSLLALSEQNLSTAAGILGADGVSGTLVDMLA